MSTPTTLQDGIDLFQAAFDALGGINSAPADPPDTPDAFPFITTRAVRLRANSNTPEDFRAMWDLEIIFLVSHGTLQDAVQSLLTFPETLLNAIYATIKNNAIPCGEVTATETSIQWGGIPCVGFAFTVHEVKIITTIT